MKARRRKLKADDLEGRFAARVEEARQRGGLTIMALAKRSGLSSVTIVHILHSQRSPCLSVVRRVAAALGVEVSHLLESKREEFTRLMRAVDAREAHHIFGILRAQQAEAAEQPKAEGGG